MSFLTIFRRSAHYSFGSSRSSNLTIPTYKYIDSKIDSKFSEIKDLIINSQKHMDERMNSFQKEIKKDINHMDEKMNTNFKNFEEKMDNRFIHFEEKMSSRFINFEEKMDGRFINFEGKVNSKMMVKAIAAGSFTFATLSIIVSFLKMNDIDIELFKLKLGKSYKVETEIKAIEK
jgi:hypothetical protein